MLFNSIEFLLFFVTVFILYWILGCRFKLQNILLLAASYFFYAWWDWRFLFLIVFSSSVDYFVGSKIYKYDRDKLRKWWLCLSVVLNLGLLFVFKYFDFFARSFSELMKQFGWSPNELTLQLILPVGISFYTFQSMSYTIDIYRGKLKPAKSAISFFTYVAFFPQLVAGPIERASNLLVQIEAPRSFETKRFNAGIFQILIGLFRKVVIADSIGIYVDSIYSNLSFHGTTTILIATILFGFQLYYDFAGYSDIAIGTAKLLGIDFKQNFNFPYFAKSVTEFWRRWHISLSTWLRDYLYIPLGGNQKGVILQYRNIMLTMLIGGLWHGASWGFVVWGGIHGLALVADKLHTSKPILSKSKVSKVLGWMITFSLVMFSWLFFRSKSIEANIEVINKLFSLELSPLFLGDINVFFTILVVLLMGVGLDFYLYKKAKPLEPFGAQLSMFQLGLASVFLVLVINLFHSTSINFIYFQF